MTATSKKIQPLQHADAEAMLPWHAAGTLGARDARLLTLALARDPDLARQYAIVREEHAETVRLNERLGAPSPRVLQKLFAAIDAECAESSEAQPAQQYASSAAERLKGYLIRLSPRALAWSIALTITASLGLGGTIGAFLMKYQSAIQSS